MWLRQHLARVLQVRQGLAGLRAAVLRRKIQRTAGGEDVARHC